MKLFSPFLKLIFLYYIFFSILYFTRNLIAENIALALLALIGAVHFLRFFKKMPSGSVRLLSFGGVFCLVTFVFHLFALFSFLFGNLFDFWPYYIRSEKSFDDVYQGEFYFITCSALMIFGWMLFNGHKFSKVVLKELGEINTSIYKIVLLFLSFLNFIFPLFFANYTEKVGLIATIINYSYIIIVCLFLFHKSGNKSFKNNILYPILLSSPLILMSIKSGMKELILFGFIPLLIGIWLLLRSNVQKFLFLSFLAVFFLLISLFVSATRMIDRQNQSNVSISLIRDNISTLIADPEIMKNLFRTALSRKNMLRMNARAFYFIDQGQVFPEYGFASGIPVLIPRLFWQSKPKIIPANDFARLTAGENSLDSDTPGFFTAIYLSSGFTIGLFYSFLFGCFIAGLQNASQLLYSTLGKALFSLNLFYMAIRLDEYFPVEALPRMISVFLVCGIIGFFLEQLSRLFLIRVR